VGFDRSEHEPEEWDPEAEYADPDSDSLTIPRVATEDAGSDLRSDLRSEFGSVEEPDVPAVETDVPSELLQAFWAIVLVVNAAVLALSLGVLFLLFEGTSTHSTALIAGGVILLGFAHRRYRTYQATKSDESAADGVADEAKPTESDTAQTPTGDATSDPASEHRPPDDSDRP
jgi:hypothetical protein